MHRAKVFFLCNFYIFSTLSLGRMFFSRRKINFHPFEKKMRETPHQPFRKKIPRFTAPCVSFNEVHCKTKYQKILSYGSTLLSIVLKTSFFTRVVARSWRSKFNARMDEGLLSFGVVNMDENAMKNELGELFDLIFPPSSLLLYHMELSCTASTAAALLIS